MPWTSKNIRSVSTHMPLARHDHRPDGGGGGAGGVSTHMPLARHDGNFDGVRSKQSVSTHMPLARHDVTTMHPRHSSPVSTHMPLARHDSNSPMLIPLLCAFLLTCLLRGMTTLGKFWNISATVSTHMPLARHDNLRPNPVMTATVSTHMPLARHDAHGSPRHSFFSLFLLTCLLRGMTATCCRCIRSCV